MTKLIRRRQNQAMSKLEKPLEKMKAKELKALLTERGVTCTACSEKDQLVAFVRGTWTPMRSQTRVSYAARAESHTCSSPIPHAQNHVCVVQKIFTSL